MEWVRFVRLVEVHYRCCYSLPRYSVILEFQYILATDLSFQISSRTLLTVRSGRYKGVIEYVQDLIHDGEERKAY